MPLTFSKRPEWQYENPDIVRRHLVSSFGSMGKQPQQPIIPSPPAPSSPKPSEADELIAAADSTSPSHEFSSLQLQGGDMTRQVYKWQADHDSDRGSLRRAASFAALRRDSDVGIGETPQDINVPGGFRRNFITHKQAVIAKPNVQVPPLQPTFMTRNFLHFLTLYGHFAGEDLEEWEDDEGGSGDAVSDGDAGDGDEERRPLLSRQITYKLQRHQATQGNASVLKAVLLLLKSFIGTGVLFLPKAFKNGGMLFSCCVLVGVALFSLMCFFLLLKSRAKVVGSYGFIGGTLYGAPMRFSILFSIAVSQIGFVCAYTIFTAESLRAFILSLSNCRADIAIPYLIMLQMVVFLPFALIRNISKLSGTAFVADIFILLGLLYLYYFDIFTIATQGVADIVKFNPKDFTLFIGTAIFTFEGIGLIIPINESMKEPEKFPSALAGVVVGLMVLFTSMGALGYAAFGTKVQTVVILNLPPHDHFVNAVQLLYSLAILLSTPLQLFPAIRIIENRIFTHSGKYNPRVKWFKNVFRIFLVIATAGISAAGADDLDKVCYNYNYSAKISLLL